MPVVIRFSSSADCRVISGTVTTPPPRPSRSTFSTLMTVMVARLQRGQERRPPARAYLAFRAGSLATGTIRWKTITALQTRDHERDAPARPYRAHPAPAGSQRRDRGQAGCHPRAVPDLAPLPRACREGRRARRLLPVRLP